ncbi:MAG: hypothetical protein IPH09_11835 [bacterium]|nr:hypothetical protein [bacterium]MBK7704006.1 hypothetical protein [bacterium]MBK9304816.1 hypothetical protein [bacterium]
MDTTLILARARRWTLAAAAVGTAAMFLATTPRSALSFLGAAVWGVAGFWLLERLIRLALVPPGGPRDRRALAGLVAGKAALYALGAWALLSGAAAPRACALGFSLLLVVLVVVGILVRPGLQLPRTEPRRRDDE